MCSYQLQDQPFEVSFLYFCDLRAVTVPRIRCSIYSDEACSLSDRVLCRLHGRVGGPRLASVSVADMRRLPCDCPEVNQTGSADGTSASGAGGSISIDISISGSGDGNASGAPSFDWSVDAKGKVKGVNIGGWLLLESYELII